MNKALGSEAGRVSIAYLIDHMNHGGGTENHLHTLVSHLDTTRFDPIIIALFPRRPEFVVSAPCEIVHLDWMRLLHWRSYHPFLRLIRILRQRHVQILQVFYPNSRLVGLLAAVCARVPHIIVSRRDCHSHPDFVRRIIYGITSRFSHYCLTNSRAAKLVVLKQERFRSDQIEVIHNSIAEIHRDLLTSPGPVRSERLVIGMVANPRPVKRVDRFLRLAHCLTDEVDGFEIVGIGTDAERRMYLDYAAELGVADRFEFRHTRTTVPQALSSFAIGVLTSESEGLSNALIEYAAGGLPAVAFDVGGNREVIEHGVTGFLAPPGREDVLTYYVRLLIHTPELRRSMGRLAQERARVTFSVDRMMAETESFYTRVVNT